MKKADRTKKGMIFNIQKFSVNGSPPPWGNMPSLERWSPPSGATTPFPVSTRTGPYGPGIRTVVFFKGCPLHCAWCANPESQYSEMQVLWNMEKCVRCHHCMEICPKKAITFFSNEIKINPYICNGCQKCIEECPARALQAEGEEKTVQGVLDVVLQDKVFYEESGGGITLSGGEMLYQPDFALQLLLAAKEEGLHTCCETTGFLKTELFAKIIEQVDYILFDMKHWNSKKHKEGTGIYNELILSNITYAVKVGKKVLPRIPVIPGFNDSLEDAIQFAATLRNIGITTCQEYKDTFIKNGIKAFF